MTCSPTQSLVVLCKLPSKFLGFWTQTSLELLWQTFPNPTTYVIPRTHPRINIFSKCLESVVRYSSKSSIGMPKCLESRTQSVASLRSVFVSHSYLDFGLHFLFDPFAHLLMLSMLLQDQNILPIQLSPSYSSRRNHPKDYASASNEALFVPKHFPINNSYSICTSQAPQKTFMHLMSHTTSNPMSHTTEKIPHITFRASFPL